MRSNSNPTYLFDKPNMCEVCHRMLPARYTDNLCPSCKEQALFSEVKNYIRSNDVNEYQVAEHFEIPHSLVKRWIHEGRIEYKELHNTKASKLQSLHCHECGTPIRFGTLCPSCQKMKNLVGTLGVSYGKDGITYHHNI